MSEVFPPDCPVPWSDDRVQLAHGGGGRRMRQLIDEVFLRAFDDPALATRADSAVVDAGAVRLAFTTDGYVVRPRFFPGGDIGKLAVWGTVNDLAMAGAVPRWLAAAFVIEEGLAIDELRAIATSMRDAARSAGVAIVTGDTKVVDRGHGDGVFITTAGVGIAPDRLIAPACVAPGDAVLLSGDVGRHGIAVMSVREGLGFEGAIASDCAPLHTLVAALLDAGIEIHCLRDLTRGGLGAALCEIAQDGRIDFRIEEPAVPVSGPVRGACEILGLDPLHVACEGRFIACVARSNRDRALELMRAHPAAAGPVCIGHAEDRPRDRPGRVLLRGALGGTRLLDLPSGEQLPRIC